MAGRAAIAYGFSKIKGDALMASGPSDIASPMSSTEFAGVMFSYQEDEKIRFYTPDEQINHTERYNEMDYRFIQGGEKIQPNYIVVICDNIGSCNIETAKEMAKGLGNIPVVIIERERCLAAQKEEVDAMIDQYFEDPNPDLAKRIKQKVRNNRVTTRNDEKILWKELDEKLDKLDIEVEKRELRENYDSITATERQNEAGRIQRVYRTIREVVGKNGR